MDKRAETERLAREAEAAVGELLAARRARGLRLSDAEADALAAWLAARLRWHLARALRGGRRG